MSIEDGKHDSELLSGVRRHRKSRLVLNALRAMRIALQSSAQTRAVSHDEKTDVLRQAVYALQRDDVKDEDGALAASAEVAPEQGAGAIRAQALGLIDVALNEAALAADMVSLLLSSTSTTAAQGISPALQAAVPAGSLASETLPNTVENAPEVGRGLVLDSASRASARLAKCSRDVKASLLKEQTFWRSVEGVRGLKRGRDGAVVVRYGKHHTARTDQVDIQHLGLTVTLAGESYGISPEAAEDEGDGSLRSRLDRARQSILIGETFSNMLVQARQKEDWRWTARSISIPLNGDAVLGISVDDVPRQTGTVPRLLYHALFASGGRALTAIVDNIVLSRRRRTLRDKLQLAVDGLSSLAPIAITNNGLSYFGSIGIGSADGYTVQDQRVDSLKQCLRTVLWHMQKNLFAHLAELKLRTREDVFDGHIVKQTWTSILVDGQPCDAAFLDTATADTKA